MDDEAPGPSADALGRHATDGDRELLERELMWAIALGGDRHRILQLQRILTPAANSTLDIVG